MRPCARPDCRPGGERRQGSGCNDPCRLCSVAGQCRNRPCCNALSGGWGRASRQRLIGIPVIFFRYFPAALPALLTAAPAGASAGTPLPEPSGLFLLGLGVAGVIVGRQLSSRKNSD
ncbi:PEP-CTERM sorting domain-containing protein [Novosphingobium sp. 2580]|uniref:PEP-CTERM sorting domain-containing protein n=2 Tax=Novosphingobium album (ex Hu et al. 2023) TaxID=2930093 RepID=A0ABT0B3U7_9SPHN|nr:PEP-CTERM sorting domain-containing protein [Novosphingobium album (ex Hu et al. 2023)]